MTVWYLLERELKAVFRNPALLLTVLGGVLFYSFLYPLPYVSQIPREQRVVVADLDGSALSRKIIRMIDATPQVSISEQVHSVAAAQQHMEEKKLAGILVIPEHFYRDLLQGRRPSLSFAGDASYFLVYSTVLEGMSAAGQTLAAEVKVTHLLQSGEPMPLAEKQYSAVRLRLHALFNEAEGYVNYVIPAVFVLILHQTLIMGIGIHCGSEIEQLEDQEEKSSVPYWLKAPFWALGLVRVFVFILIYTALSLYYFGPCLVIYDLPRLADIQDLLSFGLLFLLATSFLGLTLGALFKRREQVTLVVLLSSLPVLFSCGFIWPDSAIPHFIKAAVQLVPAVPAIKGVVQLNQMGASLAQVLPLMQQLALQALAYFVLSMLLLRRRRKEVTCPLGDTTRTTGSL